MSAVFTYSYIDSKKNIKVATHTINSLDEFIKFVLHNKEYIIWANLIDILNGSVIEQYVNIKNYQGHNLDNFNLSIKGQNLDIYKNVYIIHKLEFETLVSFIKTTNKDYFQNLIETKAFKMLSLSNFFKSKMAEQFYVFPSKIYDLIMAEFALGLNGIEMSDFQELLPIAKSVDINIEVTDWLKHCFVL